MMVFYMFLMALRDFKFSRLSMMLWLWPFWIQQDYEVNVLKLLVATTLEICEGIYQILQCFCSNKKSLSSFSSFFQPLSIHASSWSLIFMDFIIDLPPSNVYNSILVVVDCLTKTTHFILYTKIIINEGTTKLFFNHVFQYHG
jgi:hypothetical protein